MKRKHEHRISMESADRLAFFVLGPEGAAQFVIRTHWTAAQKCMAQNLDMRLGDHFACHPYPADVGIHARSRCRSWMPEEPNFADCSLLGGACWYDGSGIAAESLFARFCSEGPSAVWSELEEWYTDWLVKPE